MPLTSPDDTGVLTTTTGLDDDLRQDLTHAAWMMAAVTIPGLALAAFLLT